MGCNELTFDELKHEYRLDGKPIPSVTDIVGLLNDGKYSMNPSIVSTAALRGTMVHSLCADYDLAILDDEWDAGLDGYLRAWMSFVADYSPRWELVETMMCDTQQKYAGTVDRIGWIDDERVVVDIKTTATMDRNAQLTLATQLVGYSALWQASHTEIGKISSQHSMGVQLKDDGTYKVYRVDDIEKKYHFSALDMFYQLLNIKKIIRGIE